MIFSLFNLPILCFRIDFSFVYCLGPVQGVVIGNNFGVLPGRSRPTAWGNISVTVKIVFLQIRLKNGVRGQICEWVWGWQEMQSSEKNSLQKNDTTMSMHFSWPSLVGMLSLSLSVCPFLSSIPPMHTHTRSMPHYHTRLLTSLNYLPKTSKTINLTNSLSNSEWHFTLSRKRG